MRYLFFIAGFILWFCKNGWGQFESGKVKFYINKVINWPSPPNCTWSKNRSYGTINLLRANGVINPLISRQESGDFTYTLNIDEEVKLENFGQNAIVKTYGKLQSGNLECVGGTEYSTTNYEDIYDYTTCTNAYPVMGAIYNNSTGDGRNHKDIGTDQNIELYSQYNKYNPGSYVWEFLLDGVLYTFGDFHLNAISIDPNKYYKCSYVETRKRYITTQKKNTDNTELVPFSELPDENNVFLVSEDQLEDFSINYPNYTTPQVQYVNNTLNTEIKFSDHLNKVISFRLRNCKGNTSNEITYTIKNPSPKITSFQIERSPCYDSINSKIFINLNRGLDGSIGEAWAYNGEGKFVSATFKKNGQSEQYSANASCIYDTSNTRIVCENAMGDGKYEVTFNTNSGNVPLPHAIRTFPFTITQYPKITLTKSNIKGVNCYKYNDATLTLNATGGIGRKYKLMSSSTPMKKTDFTDGNPATLIFNDLMANGEADSIYTFQVEDEQGCKSEIITHTVTTPQELKYTLDTIEDVKCFGFPTTMKTSISGGTKYDDSSYHIESLLDGKNLPSKKIKKEMPSDYGHEYTVYAGVYDYNIRDKNSCIARRIKDSFTLYNNGLKTKKSDSTLFLNIPEPTQVKIFAQVERKPFCYGQRDGKLKIIPSGGIPPYNIYRTAAPNDLFLLVDSGTTNAGKDGKPILTKVRGEVIDSVGTSAAYTLNKTGMLLSGNYEYKVADSNNCRIRTQVFLPQPDVLKIAFDKTQLKCRQHVNGAMRAIVTGGTKDYKYKWFDRDFSHSDTILNLSHGRQTLEVTDANGCVLKAYDSIKNPPTISLQVKTVPSCGKECNGQFLVSTTQQVGNVKYLWSNTQWSNTQQNINTACPGSYFLTVEDDNACTDTASLIMPDASLNRLNIGEDVVLCKGQYKNYDLSELYGNVDAYAWFSGNNLITKSPRVVLDKSGDYIAEVKSGLGCVQRDTVNILKRENLEIKSEFITQDPNVVDKNLILINTSYPTPDSSHWIVPDVFLIDSNNQKNLYATFKPFMVGKYKTTLETFKDGCKSSYIRYVTIVPDTSTDFLTGVVDDSKILEFKVGPNPNNGTFTISVTLSEISPIKLELINIDNGYIIDIAEQSGNKSYKVEATKLLLAPGLYTLVLSSPIGSKTFTLLIQ